MAGDELKRRFAGQKRFGYKFKESKSKKRKVTEKWDESDQELIKIKKEPLVECDEKMILKDELTLKGN